MSPVDFDVDDAALLAGARDEVPAAIGALFERHYAKAVCYARSIGEESAAEDLVSEAFLKVFRQLAAGGGPTSNFGGYLATTIRNLRVDQYRRVGRVLPLPPDELPQADVADPTLDWAENELMLQALRQLPERSRQLLWLGEVLEISHQEIAERLGSNPNAVGVMRFRAREALRQAYLAAHLAASTRPECAVTLEWLPRWVRGTMPPTKRREVEHHLEACLECQAALVALEEENRRLGALLLPALALAPGLLGRNRDQPASHRHHHHRSVVTMLSLAAAAGFVALIAALAPPGDSGERASGGPDPTSGPSLTPTIPSETTSTSPTSPLGTPTPIATDPALMALVTPTASSDTTQRATPTEAPQSTPTPTPTATPTSSPPPTWTATPTSSPTPTTASTPAPTTASTPAPTTVLAWSQLPSGTSLAGRTLSAQQSGSEPPLEVSPSMILTGTQAVGYNFHVGYQTMDGPVTVPGLSPTNPAMILNLFATGSKADITVNFSRPVTGIEFDVYNFTRTDLADPNGYRKTLTFSEGVDLTGDTTALNATTGQGPFYRRQEHMNAGTLHVAAAFEPTTHFTLSFHSPEPLGAQVWFTIGVGNMTLVEPAAGTS